MRQEPTTAYTASGVNLTLSSATSATDDMYCIFLGKALQTVNPPNASVGASQIVDASITSGKLASGVLPTNTAEFLAKIGTQITLTNNTFTKATFQSEVYDPDSVYDNSTNYRFTAPSAGKYFFYANVVIHDASTDIQEGDLAFYKNGSIHATTNWQKNSGGRLRQLSMTNTVVLDLSSSDYIEVYVQIGTVDGGNGILETSSSVKNFFGGYKLIGV